MNKRHKNLVEQLSRMEVEFPNTETEQMHIASQTVVALSTHEVLCDILLKLSVIQLQERGE